MAKSSLRRVGEILILIGSIISLIFGIILLIPGLGFQLLPIAWYLGFEWLFGIILIILSLVTMATSGFIKFPWKFERDWIILLMLGVFMLLLGGDFGAVLVIIGSILLIFAK